MRRLYLILSLTCLVACANATPTAINLQDADNDRFIGWLHGNCLAIKNQDLAIQSPVTLILIDESQSIIKGRIVGTASSGDQCFALLDDRRAVNTANGYTFYLIDTKASVELAIGLLLANDRLNEYRFDYCTTAEGISFSVEENGKKYWSGYYYLGYESEATCEE